jgi:nitrite reductase/ring-hydroxylating ferredoxin subunit
MHIPKYTRREFCLHSGQVLSLAAIASAITGCGGSSSTSATSTLPNLPTINSSVSNGAITLTIDAGSPLAATGSAALIATANGNFLVSRAGDQFTALTAVCTHEQCVVSTFSSGTYQCPCHGSQYSTSGSVIKGPASRSLTTFQTSYANPVLTIRV